MSDNVWIAIYMVIDLLVMFIALYFGCKSSAEEEKRIKKLNEFRKAEREYYDLIHSDPNWIDE